MRVVRQELARQAALVMSYRGFFTQVGLTLTGFMMTCVKMFTSYPGYDAVHKFIEFGHLK